MLKSKKLLLIIIIFIPLLLSMMLNLNPQTKKISDTWQRFKIKNDSNLAVDLMSDTKFILTQQPWHFELWEQLANIQKGISDYYGMIDSFNHLKVFRKLEVNEQLALSEAYFQTNQNEYAFQVLNEIADNNPSNEEYRLVFTTQKIHDDWYSAYQTLLKWNKNDPQDAFVLYQLGLMQLLFDPENAGDTFLHAVTNNVEYTSRVRTLRDGLDGIIRQENLTYRLVLSGQLLSQNGEWEYAIAAYEYATKMDPDYAEGWALLGNALKYINEDGLPGLKKAQEINPESKIVREMLALYWRDNNDIQQSLNLLNELASEDPHEAFWKYEIGNSLIFTGDLYAALEAFQEATKLAPNDVFYWKSLAQFTIDYKISIETVGLSAARQALLIAPEDAMSYDLMGLIYLSLGNYTNSERFLIQAFEKQPLSPIVNLHLGQLYIKTGRVDDSYKYLNRSIELTHNEEIITIAQNFLAGIK